MNAFLVAAAALLACFALCGVVCVRARVIDAVVALQLAGSVMVTCLICLAQGLHSSSAFNLPVICALLVSINALVFAKFMGRFLR